MSLGTNVATNVNCYVIRWQNNTLKGALCAIEHLITKKGTKFKDTADVARSDICCQCSPITFCSSSSAGAFLLGAIFFHPETLAVMWLSSCSIFLVCIVVIFASSMNLRHVSV